MTQVHVVPGQFLRIENVRSNITAKDEHEEPKECHSSTKRELATY